MNSAIKLWLGALACAAVAVTAAAAFLPKQSLWIDESMQIAGDALGPVKIIPFLTGRETHPGLSPDRTPPISYWVQQAWGGVFGLHERPLRWLGVCCIAAATMFVFAAAARAFGLLAGWAAGLLFALSPNVIYLAVDIRAYPLFVLFSAATVWAFVKSFLVIGDWCVTEKVGIRHAPITNHQEPLTPNPSPLITGARGTSKRWLWITVALCVVTSYIHFFGVVLAGAILVATIIDRRVSKQKVSPVLIAAAIFLVAAAGLYPFIKSSIGISSQIDADAASPFRDVIRLAYRLIAHPAMAISRPLTAAGLVGAAIALVAAIIFARQSSLLIALIVGLLAVSLAAFIVKSFHPAAPHYNDWALPLLFILLPTGLAATGRIRAISAIGLALLLTAEIYSTIQLGTRGEFFAHGPFVRIAADLDRLSPDPIVVILDGPDTSTVGGTYYPLRDYDSLGDHFKQFVYADSSHVRPYTTPIAPTIRVDDLTAECVVVIRTRGVSASELVARLRTDSREAEALLPPGPIAQHLIGNARNVQSRSYLSFVAARVDVIEPAKKPRPPGGR